MMKAIMASLSAVLLVLMTALPVQAAAWDEARQVVEDATQRMFAVLEDEGLRDEARFDELLQKMDAVLDPVVDFPYISKLVMGKYYRQANDADKEQFAAVFRTTLLKGYAKAMVGFDIRSYEVMPQRSESPEPDKQIISVEVASSNGTKYQLVYYMLNTDTGWRLVNVLLDGVNLRLNFKSQFSDLAQKERGNVSKAIAAWEAYIDSSAQGSKNG